MRSTVYDSSDVLILDRTCWNATIGRFVGLIYSEYAAGRRRQLFFEDHTAARIYARGRGYKILLREEDRPDPIAIEDMLLGESSINAMAEAQYSEFVEAYGVTVVDVGLS